MRTADTVTCGNCRTEFAATALFCPSCGTAKVRELDGDPLLGKLLGERFLVQERIGNGASGTIYRAEHVTLRRRVAVKVLHHELSRDDLAIERFRREATTVSEIDNEHIVEIHDFGRTPDGRLYLAMEMLEGETLDAVLGRDQRVSVERTVDILIQLGEALMEAHAVGFIHRDLRPRNVYLAVRRGRANFVKLLDFGLAKLVEKEGEAASTSLGMTFGDPRYMSPEQARGDHVDRRADIYSLGCIGYEMLVGEAPFTGGKVFDVLTRHVNTVPVEPIARRRDIPEWLNSALVRMLAKSPADRFATVSRMVEALRQGQASGQTMAGEIARRRESIPPASVSRAMERFGLTERKDHTPPSGTPVSLTDAFDAKATAVVRRGEAPHESNKQTRPGVGVAPEAPMTLPPEELALPKSGPMPATKAPVPAPAKVPAAAVAVAAVPQAALAVAPTAPTAAPVDAPMTLPPDDFARPERAASAGGKAGRGSGGTAAASSNGRARRGSAGDSSGFSAAWFGEGDDEGKGGLDDGEKARLDRARNVITPGSTGLIGGYDDEYLPSRRRPLWMYLAPLGVVAAVVIVIAAWPGGKRKPSASAGSGSGSALALVVDAGVAPLDAGAAVALDAGAAVALDAGASGNRTTPDGGKRVDGVAKKADAGVRRPDEPVDPYADPGSGSGSGSGSVSVDDAKKADFFAKLGNQSLRSGDMLGAASNFKKALESDAKNVEAVSGLGEVALLQSLYSDAIAHLKKAAKMAPRSPRVHTLLGEAYLGAGNNAQAEAAFKKALQLDPDSRRALNGYNEAAGKLPPPTDDE